MNLFAVVLVDMLIGLAIDGDVVAVLKHLRIVSKSDLNDLTENDLRPACLSELSMFGHSVFHRRDLCIHCRRISLWFFVFRLVFM